VLILFSLVFELFLQTLNSKLVFFNFTFEVILLGFVLISMVFEDLFQIVNLFVTCLDVRLKPIDFIFESLPGYCL